VRTRSLSTCKNVVALRLAASLRTFSLAALFSLATIAFFSLSSASLCSAVRSTQPIASFFKQLSTWNCGFKKLYTALVSALKPAAAEGCAAMMLPLAAAVGSASMLRFVGDVSVEEVKGGGMRTTVVFKGEA
jgi:hypothetical protein